jgi:hypothetical protein
VNRKRYQMPDFELTTTLPLNECVARLEALSLSTFDASNKFAIQLSLTDPDWYVFEAKLCIGQRQAKKAQGAIYKRKDGTTKIFFSSHFISNPSTLLFKVSFSCLYIILGSLFWSLIALKFIVLAFFTVLVGSIPIFIEEIYVAREQNQLKQLIKRSLEF